MASFNEVRIGSINFYFAAPAGQTWNPKSIRVNDLFAVLKGPGNSWTPDFNLRNNEALIPTTLTFQNGADNYDVHEITKVTSPISSPAEPINIIFFRNVTGEIKPNPAGQKIFIEVKKLIDIIKVKKRKRTNIK